MPELPEVETIRRQLAPAIEGRVLRELRVDDPRWCEPIAPDELRAAVEGRRLERMDRRGKYLIWAFAGEVFLLGHLRMTGSLLIDPVRDHQAGSDRARYERVRLFFAAARGIGPAHQVAFCDPRRFGTGELALGQNALDAFFAARVGVEPLGPEFTTDVLVEAARGRRVAIKPFLLDQRRIAGVGNIYADEALFRARIHPLRPAGSLKRAQLAELRDAIVAVLTAGLGAGGATIDDFRHTDGVYGAFQDEFLVHRHRGEPCPVCGGTIVKLVVAGRGTYVCERCQRPPRGVHRQLAP
jgi:formamidopyrimidine-DNA glycosylase